MSSKVDSQAWVFGAPGRLLIALCLVAFLWGLVGCAGSRPRPAKQFRGNPVGYVQRGIASWYGPGFHGNLTANGEKYNMHAYTAAHRWWKYGLLQAITGSPYGSMTVGPS